MSPKLEQLAAALAPLVAERVAEHLTDRLGAALEGAGGGVAEGGLITAREAAERFAVSRAWIYEHADELGVIRLGSVGDGKRPRLRFDPERVAEILGAATAPAETRHRPAADRRRGVSDGELHAALPIGPPQPGRGR